MKKIVTLLLMCLGLYVHGTDIYILTVDQTAPDNTDRAAFIVTADLNTGRIKQSFSILGFPSFNLSTNLDGTRVYASSVFEPAPNQTNFFTYLFNTQTGGLVSTISSNSIGAGAGAGAGILYDEFVFSRQAPRAWVSGGQVVGAENILGILTLNTSSNEFTNFTPFPGQDFSNPNFFISSNDQSILYVGESIQAPPTNRIYLFDTSSQSFLPDTLDLPLRPLNGIESKDGNTLYVIGYDTDTPANSKLYLINTATRNFPVRAMKGLRKIL